ncbi:N-acetylmuramoyl-L-alanine amidase [Flavobacteriaceae bacterium F08102]|nr:N-acetylmuramoyl-L-alanine amidase [Flavobacteriaceae bacterium F08102]
MKSSLNEMNKFKLFLLLLLSSFFIPQILNAQRTFKVVLDAGHGGSDPGNLGNSHQEKDIVLKITKEVGRLLSKEPGIEIIYTREDDTFVELHERGRIAHQAKANIFVSIHCDAYDSPAAYGAGTFVLAVKGNTGNFRVAQKENSSIFLEDNYKEKYGGFDPNSPESVIGLTMMQEEHFDESLILASFIQQRLVGDLKRKDRLVRQGNFLVLRETFMPSVLVEAGFLTNKKEGEYLNSKKGQMEVATAIYKGILAYKKHVDANTVIEKPPVEVVEKKKVPEKRVIKGVDFKVQISSSTKKVKTDSYNFKGLKGVERVRVGAHYKYYFGKTSDYNEVKSLQSEAKAKGYTSSFIVAFKNGTKISVKDALDGK